MEDKQHVLTQQQWMFLNVFNQKKVMEMGVVQTFNVLRARVVDRIVVVAKEDPVDALIVITAVTVQRVVPIITNLTLSVTPKKVMEVRVLQTVNVLHARVVDRIVVVAKEDPVDALIVITAVTVQRVVPIITNLTLSVTPAVAVKQVLPVQRRGLLALVIHAHQHKSQTVIKQLHVLLRVSL